MAYGVGRPATKPTQAQIDTICDCLRKGNFRETAIAFAGVSPAIVRNWIRSGVKDLEAGEDTLEASLVTGMRKAEAEAEVNSVNAIGERGFNPFVTSRSSRSDDKGNNSESETVAPPDWKALAWILERRGSKNWGFKKSLDVTINRDRAKLLDVAEKTLDDEQFNKLLAAIAAAEDAGGDGEGETSGADSDE